MLNRIQIQNFRSFRDIEIGPFKRVNLIAGLNNAGKTGLLEAIYLTARREIISQGPFMQPSNFWNLFRVFSPQTNLDESFWPWLFHDKNLSEDIKIAIFDETGREEVFVMGQTENMFPKGRVGIDQVSNLGPLVLEGICNASGIAGLTIEKLQGQKQSRSLRK